MFSVFFQSAKQSCVKTQTSLQSRGLGSPARSSIGTTLPFPAPPPPALSPAQPRWPPVIPTASPCRSCCTWSLCCYCCCSPAPRPYVSMKSYSFTIMQLFYVMSYILHPMLNSRCAFLWLWFIAPKTHRAPQFLADAQYLFYLHPWVFGHFTIFIHVCVLVQQQDSSE